MTINQLAQSFVDATVNKWGTDEDAVYQIMKTVHDQDVAGEFEVQVFSTLSESQRESFVSSGKGRLIPTILQSEMSGSQLARAEDLFLTGQDSYRANSADYFFEGLGSVVDFSSTESKVVLAAGVVLLGGLALVSAPATGVVGGALVIGTALYGGGKIIKNGIELVFSETDAEFKGNMRDLGAGVGVTALSAPFAPKGVNGIRNGITVLRAPAQEAAAEAALASQIAARQAAATKQIGPQTEAELKALLEAALVNGQPKRGYWFESKDAAQTAEIEQAMAGEFYGDLIVKDSRRWALMMELAMEQGYALTQELAQVCESATGIGFSGAAHWQASKFLTHVWVHGENFSQLNGAFLPVFPSPVLTSQTKFVVPNQDKVGIAFMSSTAALDAKESLEEEFGFCEVE